MTPPFTVVYGGDMGPSYRWDEATYDRLARAGIPWQAAQAVLDTHPQIRQHIGSVLRIAAPVPDWVTGQDTWIVVALIEEADD